MQADNPNKNYHYCTVNISTLNFFASFCQSAKISKASCLYLYMSSKFQCVHEPVHLVVLQHPVTWQPSKEGDHLIGRITLSKRSAAMPKEAGALLGLKVREIDNY